MWVSMESADIFRVSLHLLCGNPWSQPTYSVLSLHFSCRYPWSEQTYSRVSQQMYCIGVEFLCHIINIFQRIILSFVLLVLLCSRLSSYARLLPTAREGLSHTGESRYCFTQLQVRKPGIGYHLRE